MKALRWIRDHWYLPLIALAGVLGVVAGVFLQRKPAGPKTLVKEELQALSESNKVRLVLAEEGHEAAKKVVEEKHYELSKVLEGASKEKAARLLENPVALSRHLERVGQSLRR